MAPEKRLYRAFYIKPIIWGILCIYCNYKILKEDLVLCIMMICVNWSEMGYGGVGVAPGASCRETLRMPHKGRQVVSVNYWRKSNLGACRGG